MGKAVVVTCAGMIDFTPYRWHSHEPLHCCGFRDEKQASLRGNEHKTVRRTEKNPLPTKTLPVRPSRVMFPSVEFWSSAIPDISTPTSALERTQISLCCDINKISFQSHFYLLSAAQEKIQACTLSNFLFFTISFVRHLSVFLFQSIIVIKFILFKGQNDLNDVPFDDMTRFPDLFLSPLQPQSDVCTWTQQVFCLRPGLWMICFLHIVTAQCCWFAWARARSLLIRAEMNPPALMRAKLRQRVRFKPVWGQH